MPEAIVFDIQRYSLHDGPGIRTLVFFKGCSLRCGWCCNPESQVSAPEYAHDPEKCRQCLICQKVCPLGRFLWRTAAPNRIWTCAPAAKSIFAKTSARKSVFMFTVKNGRRRRSCRKLKRMRCSFTPRGRVTATGGEALLPDFLRAFFALCRAEGYSTAVETCLHVGWEAVEKVLPETDLFLCDFKHADPARFREATGGDLGLVMANQRRLAASGADILPRIPLIPGFNADEKTVDDVCGFIRTLGLKTVCLLPYHSLGSAKYARLGRGYPMEGTSPLTQGEIEKLAKTAQKAGLTVQIGG